MKLELWSTCISLRIMLTICSSVCNCSESFGCYAYNNWLKCFKMSNKLVPKNYQNTIHISAKRRSTKWLLLRLGGGMGNRQETEQECVSESGHPVMAMWCDWTMCPLASQHQPIPLWPVLPAPSCQGQMQTKKTKTLTDTHPNRLHVRDNALKTPKTAAISAESGLTQNAKRK